MQTDAKKKKVFPVLSLDNIEHIKKIFGNDLFSKTYTSEGFLTEFNEIYNEAFKMLLMKVSKKEVAEDELIYSSIYFKEFMNWRIRNLLEFQDY